jgi:hypothetical protein
MSVLPPDKERKALGDRLLLEQGRLDPFELLLAAELLGYEDYEAWCTGRRQDVQGALRGAPDEVAELLERAGAYATDQRLAVTPLEHRAWGPLEAALRVGDRATLVRACAKAFAPSPDRIQPDLFQGSIALVLEEEIRRALAERRSDRAREQVVLLMRQDPRGRRLRGFLRLIQLIDDSERQSSDERLAGLLALEPLARELLGPGDRDFLTPLWTALGESPRGRTFDPAAPQLHASFAWARAGRGPGAGRRFSRRSRRTATGGDFPGSCWLTPRPVGAGSAKGRRAGTGCGCAGSTRRKPSGPSSH